MPLNWTSTILPENYIESSVMVEIKNNMNLTYNRICYSQYSTYDTTERIDVDSTYNSTIRSSQDTQYNSIYNEGVLSDH